MEVRKLCGNHSKFFFSNSCYQIDISSGDVRYAVVTVKGVVTSSTHFMSERDTTIHLNTLNYEGSRDDQGGAAAVISTARNLEYVL